VGPRERLSGRRPCGGDPATLTTLEVQDGEGESGIWGDKEINEATTGRDEEGGGGPDPTYPYLRIRIAHTANGRGVEAASRVH